MFCRGFSLNYLNLCGVKFLPIIHFVRKQFLCLFLIIKRSSFNPKTLIMKLKTTYILLLLCAVSFQNFAQSGNNKISFDMAYGYNQAVQPIRRDQSASYGQMNHLEIGVRYMITEKFGVRLNYANDRFKNAADGIYGSNFSRVGIDAVYNLGKFLGLDLSSRNTIGLLTHAGVGYTRLKPNYQEKSEQIGAVVLGVTPQVKITERIALFLDGSYNINFKQHYGFDGALLTPDYTPNIGSHYTVALGIVVYIGQNKYHSDWN